METLKDIFALFGALVLVMALGAALFVGTRKPGDIVPEERAGPLD